MGSDGEENARNQMSMSTQEKLLMRPKTGEALNLNSESNESTISQIARDFIDLYNLEKNGTSRRSASKEEASSIAQEIAIDLIEFQVKKTPGPKVFATFSRVDEEGMAHNAIGSRLMMDAAPPAQDGGATVSMVERGLQFKTYFC